ncbi:MULTISPECIES: HsmA family protein [Clostridium]|uniref:HsmA family protein n=1 Tax=Clostridium TaxID=1485 RepID=UPI0004D6CF51|nr:MULTISPECIES: HsmA family protein [Clostridium]KEH85092.1 membrane protein [Clostridium novyi A str. 4540]KEH91476.1 membrane protein [Clostridium novyi A str. GD211209]KEH91719.1 membrane protein [Clostridium botulinum C/D str. It1]
MLAKAIVFITLALIFYTIGVFSEKKQGTLKVWHVVVFWCGLVCDTLGTSFMGKIAGSMFEVNIHGITGLLAIILMLFHAIWATIVLVRNSEQSKRTFHKFSIVVWIIWLIPYLSGMFVGMSK